MTRYDRRVGQPVVYASECSLAAPADACLTSSPVLPCLSCPPSNRLLHPPTFPPLDTRSCAPGCMGASSTCRAGRYPAWPPPCTPHRTLRPATRPRRRRRHPRRRPQLQMRRNCTRARRRPLPVARRPLLAATAATTTARPPVRPTNKAPATRMRRRHEPLPPPTAVAPRQLPRSCPAIPK